MRALILAGGKGTRLRPLTVYTPKPIVPVLNRPFLLYQIDILRRSGITDITLSLSYQPAKIEEVLGDGSDFGVSLKYVTEPIPLGTAGAYKFAAENYDDTMLVFNGDIITDLKLADLIARHKDSKAEATIALKPVEDPSAYGLVETDKDNRVLNFLEKPKPEQLKDLKVNTINAGIYVLEPSILEMIVPNENTSFEYNVFPQILEKGDRFSAFVMDENYWRDIGNPASYLAAHHDFLSGKIKGFEFPEKLPSEIATAASIDKTSVIGEGCIIKPNAQIFNSVLGPGVHVEERAVIKNSVLWGHTRVSAHAELNGAVIGRSSHIGKNVVVGEGCVLGDKASLPDYSRI